MTLIATLVVTAALCPLSLAAQDFKPSANPVSDAVRERLARDSKNLVGAAELLPAEKYSYHPTPAQMTFGQLIVHIVQTNVALCSAISTTPAPMTPDQLQKLSDKEAKDALVAALKRSFDYCTESIGKVSDSQLGEQGVMFGRPIPQSRGAVLVTIAADWADHYSTAAAYLRLNDILPPSAQPKK